MNVLKTITSYSPVLAIPSSIAAYFLWKGQYHLFVNIMQYVNLLMWVALLVYTKLSSKYSVDYKTAFTILSVLFVASLLSSFFIPFLTMLLYVTFVVTAIVVTFLILFYLTFSQHT